MDEGGDIQVLQDGLREISATRSPGTNDLDFLPSFHALMVYKNRALRAAATSTERGRNNDYPTLSLDDMEELLQAQIKKAREDDERFRRELSEME